MKDSSLDNKLKDITNFVDVMIGEIGHVEQCLDDITRDHDLYFRHTGLCMTILDNLIDLKLKVLDCKYQKVLQDIQVDIKEIEIISGRIKRRITNNESGELLIEDINILLDLIKYIKNYKESETDEPNN